MSFYFHEISPMLSRLYRQWGLSNDEFLILNTCLVHHPLILDEKNLDLISDVTSQPKDRVKSILIKLYKEDKISYVNGEYLDFSYIERKLKNFEYSLMSMKDKIADSISYYETMNFSNNDEFNHLGQVELLPLEKGMAISSGYNRGEIWSVKDIQEIINELNIFLEYSDQGAIDNYNEKIRQTKRHEIELREAELKERKEKAQAASLPKQGIVIVFQLSNTRYKFSYSYKISASNKIENIKATYGDSISIIHTFETYDTLTFFHQFIKKQFSNRLFNNGEYTLTDDDVDFLKSEKFPSNAMEWLNGAVSSNI
ncbi:hypothetical protein RKD55_004745 [Rossellomorea marisflavi]